MVLPPGGSGRVGYRRPNNFTHSTRHTNPHGLCGGCLSSYAYPYCWLRAAYTGVRIADNTTRTNKGVDTNETSCGLRIADNHPTNNGCAPTSLLAGKWRSRKT